MCAVLGRFVRCNQPGTLGAAGYSPQLGNDGTLADWRSWARTDETWARVATHALGEERVSNAYASTTHAPHYPYRRSLARFLTSYSKVATLSTSGQSYLNGHIRLACPAYVTSLSGLNAFAHASEYIKDSVNSVMGGAVHRTVAAQYNDVKWSSATQSQFFLACAILDDAVSGVCLYINADVLKHTGDTPALVVISGYSTIADTVAVAHKGVLYTARTSFIDVLGYWLTLQADNGVHTAFSGETPPPVRLATHITPDHSR